KGVPQWDICLGDGFVDPFLTMRPPTGLTGIRKMAVKHESECAVGVWHKCLQSGSCCGERVRYYFYVRGSANSVPLFPYGLSLIIQSSRTRAEGNCSRRLPTLACRHPTIRRYVIE